MAKNYYQDQLERIGKLTDVVFDNNEGEKTHRMKLNEESLPIIIKHLQGMLEQLKNNQ